MKEGCGTLTGDIVTLAAFGARNTAPVDAAAERTRFTWSAGDYARIAAGYSTAAEAFAEGLGFFRGESVLDVACGTGTLSIPAAHAGASVTAVDITPRLLQTARALGAKEGLSILFDVGDAEALPYGDASFATTMSMFGVMFACRPERALAELFRVTRPGGRIALANWTPSGFVGEMLRLHTALVPSPAGIPSALAWGDPDRLHGRLARHAARIRSVRFAINTVDLAYPHSPGGVVELFRENYGPIVRAYAALDADERALLSHDLLQLWARNERGVDGFTRARAEVLEVRIDLK